jgi:adenylosuccinate synthase
MLVRNNPENIELAEMYRHYQRTLSPKLLLNKYRSFASAYPSSIVDGEEYFARLLESQKTIVCEGAQGALLDLESGFAPYVTKTRTTFASAEELLAGRVRRSDMEKIGIMRAYGHRHGAGPLVTEDEDLTRALPEVHNVFNLWQREFRVGWFDLPAIRYGVAINGEMDSIALTNLDRLSGFKKVKVCISYLYSGSLSQELDDLFEWEYCNDEIRITGFKKQTGSEGRNGLADILFKCKPWDFKEFPGWQNGISNIKRLEDLPREARAYVDFLQSSEGVDVPISVISVGPTSKNKILYNSC